MRHHGHFGASWEIGAKAGYTSLQKSLSYYFFLSIPYSLSSCILFYLIILCFVFISMARSSFFQYFIVTSFSLWRFLSGRFSHWPIFGDWATESRFYLLNISLADVGRAWKKRWPDREWCVGGKEKKRNKHRRRKHGLVNMSLSFHPIPISICWRDKKLKPSYGPHTHIRERQRPKKTQKRKKQRATETWKQITNETGTGLLKRLFLSPLRKRVMRT